jgi:hypothetical protein
MVAVMKNPGPPTRAEFHEAISSRSDRWYAACLKITRNQDLAEDAVQEALAIGIGIGIFIGGDEPVSPIVQEIVADSGSLEPDASSAFLRGLQVHLRDSEKGLLELAPTDNRTELILSIIEQNKLFERAAEQNDSANLARVLRAFELVLVRLASEDISPEDAEALRTKLLFELNVMLTKLSRDTSEEQQTI